MFTPMFLFFAVLPPQLPALPQPVEFQPRTHESVSLPASCDCKSCQCKACDGVCLAVKPNKVGFSHVAQNCPGGVCQLPVAQPKRVYAPRPQVHYLPRYSSGGCANGQCSPQRRGLFGRR